MEKIGILTYHRAYSYGAKLRKYRGGEIAQNRHKKPERFYCNNIMLYCFEHR